jgi:hypothetical protein
MVRDPETPALVVVGGGVVGAGRFIGGQLATTHTMSNDQGQNTIAAQTSGLLVDPVTLYVRHHV